MPSSEPPHTASAAAASQPSDTLKKQIFDLVKKGEVDEVVRVVRETGIDIANLLEEPKNFS